MAGFIHYREPLKPFSGLGIIITILPDSQSDVSARWLKASRALKKEEQVYGQELAEIVKKHSSEAFYAFDDPLEAAVFSVLVEMMGDMDEERKRWTRSPKT